MAYVDQTAGKNRQAAIIGVVAVHAALGYALVSGLAVDFVKTVIPANPDGIFVPIPEPKTPPPPPPQPSTEKQAELTTDRPIVVPNTPIDLSSTLPKVDTTTIPLPPIDIPIPKVGPSTAPTPMGTKAPPKFDPVGAAPRGNPGEWVTQNDYRSSWINREMTGTAKFSVEVSPAGRVQSCRITKSSGHGALDDATCKLITSRARFDPAKNGNGDKVGGSYASSVRWQLPD